MIIRTVGGILLALGGIICVFYLLWGFMGGILMAFTGPEEINVKLHLKIFGCGALLVLVGTGLLIVT